MKGEGGGGGDFAFYAKEDWQPPTFWNMQIAIKE